jgi:RNA polymerase sigma-70 factor (TIGR02960 family)
MRTARGTAWRRIYHDPVTGTTLERARLGDEQAFRELCEPFQRELRAHCYRMLGSLTDAEDQLQETLLAAWRGLPAFRQQASVRTWLYRIATNRCLNVLRDNARRPVQAPVPPFDPPEPTRRDAVTWLQPYPDFLLDPIADPAARYDTTEAIQLAFVAAMQRMPPRQVAVLLLRDVLDFGADEVATMLESTPAAVKGLLQRARASVPPRSPAASRAAHDAVARRFAAAYTAGDLDGLIALLTDDAWLSMPPAEHEYHGLEAIEGFWRASFRYRGDTPVRLVPVGANRQPGFACYLGGAGGVSGGIFVLSVAGDRIGGVIRFHCDEVLFGEFGLPRTLEAGVWTT